MAAPPKYDVFADQIEIVELLRSEGPQCWGEMRAHLQWTRYRLDCALKPLLLENLVRAPVRTARGAIIYCVVLGKENSDVAVADLALQHPRLKDHRSVLEYVRAYPRETWSSLLEEIENCRGISRRKCKDILSSLETWGLIYHTRVLSEREKDIKHLSLNREPPITKLTVYEALGPPSDPHRWIKRRSERSRRREERDRMRRIAGVGQVRAAG